MLLLQNYNQMEELRHHVTIKRKTIVAIIAMIIIMDVKENMEFIVKICGSIAGLLVGFSILKNNATVDECKPNWQWFSILIFILLAIVSVLINVFDRERFPSEDTMSICMLIFF